MCVLLKQSSFLSNKYNERILPIISNLFSLSQIQGSEFPEYLLTPKVKKTLQLFQEYRFKIVNDDTQTIPLGPYNIKENDCVYMGHWYKGQRWGKGK